VTFIRRPGTGAPRVAPLATFVRGLAAATGSRAGEVTVVLARDTEMRELNRRYRGTDRTTDVLSFPPGDLIISVDQARRQAAQRHHSLDRELRYLLLHGFLHLMGWDHETDDGEMEAEERRLRVATGLENRPATPRAVRRRA
jgi:probable rRNA maturation factor